MNENSSQGRKLTRQQATRRAVALGAVAIVLAGLRIINPETISWIPLRTSCGAMTGLPCIFCGTTRAMHHLLHGQFAQALYFNWLAFPVTIAGCCLAVIAACELLATRRLVVLNLRLQVTPRLAAMCGAHSPRCGSSKCHSRFTAIKASC